MIAIAKMQSIQEQIILWGWIYDSSGFKSKKKSLHYIDPFVKW